MTDRTIDFSKKVKILVPLEMGFWQRFKEKYFGGDFFRQEEGFLIEDEKPE